VATDTLSLWEIGRVFKNSLRKMFACMNMDVIDYDPKEVEKYL